jgi:cytochrome c biogenesis factor
MLLLSGLPALPLMLALARAVGATPLAPAINLAGRGSLAVLCIQATAAVVIASMLVLLGLDSLWPLTVVTVAASTWLVLGAAEVAQRHGIARALGIAVTP